MQTVELITGNEIYEQLIDMITCTDNSVIRCQSQLVKIQDFCSEARKTWASAAFSDMTDVALKRYFSYQLKSISGIFGLLDEHQAESNVDQARFCMINNEILLLLDHLVVYFKAYVDISVDCPYVFKDQIVKGILTKINAIYSWIDYIDGPATALGVAVVSYVKQFETSGKKIVFNFGELLFFIRFVNDFSSQIQNLVSPDKASLLADQLLKLEFNHYSVFDYFQSTIEQRLKGSGLEKRKKIEAELRLLGCNCDQEMLLYDFRWPRIGDMLSDWLLQEQKKLENEIPIDAPPVAGCKSPRMQVTLSVSQLAGLAKLFVKENIFGNQAVNDVFAFFTNGFSSKRQEVFSQGNFIKEYYSISQVTAAELRDLLLRMVARINRDFFPVVVAVGLLTLCY